MRKAELADEYVVRYRDKPFDWATWNCAHFMGEFVLEYTGVDPLEKFAHSSEEEARAVLEAAGGIVTAMSSVLPAIEVCRAMKGDIVLGNEEGGSALGICLGVFSAYVGPSGMIYRRTSEALRAWRVG